MTEEHYSEKLKGWIEPSTSVIFCFVLSPWHKLELFGTKNLNRENEKMIPPLDCQDKSSLYGTFLTDVEGPTQPLGVVPSWASGPGVYERVNWADQREWGSKQHSFLLFQFLHLFLPSVTALTSPEDGRYCKP